MLPENVAAVMMSLYQRLACLQRNTPLCAALRTKANHITNLQHSSVKTVPCCVVQRHAAFPAGVRASLKPTLSAAPGRQTM